MSVHGDVALQIQNNWNPVPVPRLSVVLLEPSMFYLCGSLGDADEPWLCWQQRALSHFSFSGNFCTAMFACGVTQPVSQSFSSSRDTLTPLTLWDLHSMFCHGDSWVFPPVRVAATWSFIQWDLRVVLFLFTVNILQHFKWCRQVSPWLFLLMISKFSNIQR